MQKMEDTDDSDDSSPPVDVSKQLPAVQKSSSAIPVVSNTGSRFLASFWRSKRQDLSSGQPCPTCHGTGRLPRGQRDELVALIPYSDKRLKPRRRWCVYVSVVLVLLLVCGSLLLAFMFPRSASITLLAMNSSNHWVPADNDTDTNILMETHVRIRNDNFFQLEVQWLRLALSNVGVEVGSKQVTPVSVGPRQEAVAVVTQNATFTGELGSRVRTICTGNDWSHCLSMFAEAEMRYTVLAHTAEALASKTFFVSCDFLESNTSTSSCS